MITCITYLNPLRPDQQTISFYEPGATLRVMTRVHNPGADEWPTPTVALVNGEAWMRARWDKPLQDGACVEFRCGLSGGGAGTSRSIGVAEIAIGGLLVATGVGGPIGYGLIFAGALTLATSYLVPKPSVPSYLSSDSGSPTYSISYTSNRKRIGEPIPVVYGRHRLLPDLVSSGYTYYSGDDQYLVAVLCLGLGEFAVDTTTLKFGETPFSELDGVTYELVGPGTPFTTLSGSAAGVHDNVNVSEAVNGQTVVDTSWLGEFSVTAFVNAQYLAIDLVAPRGLGTLNGDGSISTRSVTVNIVYRGSNIDGSVLGAPITRSVVISGAQQKPVRITEAWNIAAGAAGYAKILIKIQRTTAENTLNTELDNVTLTGLRSLGNDVYGRAGVTCMLVTAKASGQLSAQQSQQINVVAQRMVQTVTSLTPVPAGHWSSTDKDASVTLSGGDDIATFSTLEKMVRGTIARSASDAVAGSRKWYLQFSITEVYAARAVGITIASHTLSGHPGSDATSHGVGFSSDGLSANFHIDGVDSAATTPFGIGDLVGLMLDLDADTVEFDVNGTAQGPLSIAAGQTWIPSAAAVDIVDSVWLASFASTTTDPSDLVATVYGAGGCKSNLSATVADGECFVWECLVGTIGPGAYPDIGLSPLNAATYPAYGNSVVYGSTGTLYDKSNLITTVAGYSAGAVITIALYRTGGVLRAAWFVGATLLADVAMDEADYWAVIGGGGASSSFDATARFKRTSITDAGWNAIKAAHPTLTLKTFDGIAHDDADVIAIDCGAVISGAVPWAPGAGVTWSDPVGTSSIAWALADALRNDEYGAGLDDSEIDLAALFELDALWGGRGDEFNGVFDQSGTCWDALQKIARAGRAQPVLSGGVTTFVRDSVKATRTAMFTPSSILPGSLSIAYKLPLDGDPDGTSAAWIDPTTWQPAHIDIIDGTTDVPINPQTVDLFGITVQDQATREAHYLDRLRQRRRKAITWRTEMDGHLVSVGDLVALSHDVPAWGQSADLTGVSGTTYTVTEPLTWTPAATHYVLLRRPDGSVFGPYAVTEVVGQSRQFTLSTALDFTPAIDLTSSDRTNVIFGPSANYRQDVTILSVTPQDGCTVELQAVPYDATITDDLTARPALWAVDDPASPADYDTATDAEKADNAFWGNDDGSDFADGAPPYTYQGY